MTAGRRITTLMGGLLLIALIALLSGSRVQAAEEPDTTQSCTGKFPNLISDICWSCIFPLRIAGRSFINMKQEDFSFGGDTGATCSCSNPLRFGIPVSFWEPVRMVEVVRKPMCFPTLGGSDMSNVVDAPRGLRKGEDNLAFYHVHWYQAPLLVVLEVLLDYDLCMEKGSLDLAYMTELDPLWSDAELTQLLNPDVFLYANPIAQAACAADCVAASLGFPLSDLYWCAGCQGSMYPLTGHIAHASGGVPSSALLMQRMSAKLHRELLVWGTWGEEGKCGLFPIPIMDKRAYKFQLVSPPATEKVEGRCCHPFGRAHQVWGLGKEIPMGQHDFTYLVFRKRNCCFSILGL